MTLYSASLSLLVLLLFTNTIDARRDPGEYWKRLMKHQIMPETIRARLVVSPESEDVVPSSALIERSNLNKFFDFDPDKRSVRPQYIYHGQNHDTEEESTTSTSVDFVGMNQELQSETNMQDGYLWFYDQPKQDRVYDTSSIA